MDFFATPLRRKVLFGCLYLSEGAPIGYIWLALPVRLRGDDVPLPSITRLAALLVLPWTFKFVWAPLVDVIRTDRWTLRHWIVSCQALMCVTLLPLTWLDLRADFPVIASLLFVHALAAATQDVAIDALCIAVTEPAERGRMNGWMQAGMLLGRAMMGGGALVLGTYVRESFVVGLLMALVASSAIMLLVSHPRPLGRKPAGDFRDRSAAVRAAARKALGRRNTWFGLLFALMGGAAFKSLEIVYGPFLVDRGYDQAQIGWFSAGPMIVSMIVGAVVGGQLADRRGRGQSVAVSLLFFVTAIALLAASDLLLESRPGAHLFLLLAASAFGIGLFTAASYALFMDISHPDVAATQFSAFMGATNGCESWSSAVIGLVIASHGYPAGMLAMCGVSLCTLPLIWGLRRDDRDPPAGESPERRPLGTD